MVIVFSQGAVGATGARGDVGLPGVDVSNFCNSGFKFLLKEGTLLSSCYRGSHFARTCIFRFTLRLGELTATVFYLAFFAKHVGHQLLTPKRQHKFHVTILFAILEQRIGILSMNSSWKSTFFQNHLSALVGK